MGLGDERHAEYLAGLWECHAVNYHASAKGKPRRRERRMLIRQAWKWRQRARALYQAVAKAREAQAVPSVETGNEGKVK